MVKVFAVGDLNVDVFTHVRGLTEFGTEAHAEKFYCTLGGNAANFAAAIASLGVGTALVSALGSGQFAQFLRSQLKKFHVKPLLHKSSLQNGVSNIFVRKDGERAILSNKGCLAELDTRTVAKALIPRLSAGDIVFFGGFFHLPRMRKNFLKLLKAIKRKNAAIVFDACYDEYGKWQVRDFLRQIDVFILNETELLKIAPAKTTGASIRKLQSWGAEEVVLKRGQKGAECHSAPDGTEPLHVPAPKVKAFNATGAGDFFNAGYVYGLAHGFSALNCLRCGNFVASRKVASKEYMPELRRPLQQYLAAISLPEIEIKGSASAMAKEAVKRIALFVNRCPNAVISLAAGKTPLPIYSGLVGAFRRREVDFSRCTFLELDEYLGLENLKDGFAYSLRKNFLGKVNFRNSNIFLFDSRAKSLSAERKKAESIIRRKGLGLVLLGIGENAHIAFNEPGTRFGSATHAVNISKAILRARRKEFRGAEPTKAITLGIGTIMSATALMLVANGRKKARAVARAFKGKISESAPASVLQRHPNSCVILDKAAASKL